MNLSLRIQKLLISLQEGIYEKEEAVKLALLAAVAGESIFLLGPPGVAKSLIARKLKFAFQEGKSFEYLMNRFSTPDEIFGPVSIKKLKDEDKYERLTDKYLPGANVVFLDEIWKAGPAIQNALLTVLNEKIYRNGEQEIAVNIKAIIAASNELPASGEGLTALWDRFLLRFMITEIRKAGNFIDMITDTQNVYADTLEETIKISTTEIEAWSLEIDQVEMPAEVLNVIQLIKKSIDEYDEKHEEKFRVYDRRWKKMVRLLRTSAFLNERKKVDLMDCFLMPHCLWNVPEQLEIAQEIVAGTIRKHGYTLAVSLTPLKNEIRELDEEVKNEVCVPNIVLVDKVRLVAKEYHEILNIDQYFDGKWLKAAEFDRLTIDEDSTINLYDTQGNLTNRLKARRSQTTAELFVKFNEKTFTFRMLADKEEKAEIIYKKPHPVLQKFWHERLENLGQYIKNQQNHLENDLPEEIQQLKNNIFVEANLSQIVESNLNETRQTLQKLALQLDKIRHFYETLT
ncbi:MAG: AAA family ATPase [Verrucomicrobia bacterium]|nr:AAA family ATPase [Cytophagales bacterium]